MNTANDDHNIRIHSPTNPPHHELLDGIWVELITQLVIQIAYDFST